MRELDAIPKDDEDVKMYKGVGKMYVEYLIGASRLSRGNESCSGETKDALGQTEDKRMVADLDMVDVPGKSGLGLVNQLTPQVHDASTIRSRYRQPENIQNDRIRLGPIIQKGQISGKAIQRGKLSITGYCKFLSCGSSSRPSTVWVVSLCIVGLGFCIAWRHVSSVLIV